MFAKVNQITELSHPVSLSRSSTNRFERPKNKSIEIRWIEADEDGIRRRLNQQLFLQRIYLHWWLSDLIWIDWKFIQNLLHLAAFRVCDTFLPFWSSWLLIFFLPILKMIVSFAQVLNIREPLRVHSNIIMQICFNKLGRDISLPPSMESSSKDHSNILIYLS